MEPATVSIRDQSTPGQAWVRFETVEPIDKARPTVRLRLTTQVGSIENPLLTTDLDARWQGYRFLVEGHEIPRRLRPTTPRYWSLEFPPPYGTYYVQPYCQRVWYHESAIIAEILTTPSGQDFRHWILADGPWTQTDYQSGYDAMVLAQQLEYIMGDGREAETRQLALAAARILNDGRKLDRESLAAAFGIERSSLDDKMKRAFRGGIRDIQRTPLADLKLGRIYRK
jgi:hypothetical protein